MAGELSFSSEYHHLPLVIQQATTEPVNLTGDCRQVTVNYLFLLGSFLRFLLGGFLLRYFPFFCFLLSSFLSLCHNIITSFRQIYMSNFTKNNSIGFFCIHVYRQTPEKYFTFFLFARVFCCAEAMSQSRISACVFVFTWDNEASMN